MCAASLRPQQMQQAQREGRRPPMGKGPALGVTRGLTVKMRGLPFRVAVRFPEQTPVPQDLSLTHPAHGPCSAEQRA